MKYILYPFFVVCSHLKIAKERGRDIERDRERERKEEERQRETERQRE